MSTKHKNFTVFIEGMDCSNCAAGITKTLQKKGIEEVNVNFATGEANFVLKDEKLLNLAISSIENLGYKVLDQQKYEVKQGKMSDTEKRFYFSLPFTLTMFFSHMFLPHHLLINHPLSQLLLCIPVMYIGIIHFGKSSWASIKTGIANMDVLIFIGSSSAFIYSLLGIYIYNNQAIVHNYVYFETAATIITLVLLGNVLEHRSVKQTTSAISELNALQVSKAKILQLHLGKEIFTEIDIKDIHEGAIIQVNSGDSIPVDGELISGRASVNESMLTGESTSVEKNIGSIVFAGTLLLDGNFRMRAEKIYEDTMLGQIISLVKKAQNQKPNIQRLGDKISAVFVPVVIFIALANFIISYFIFDIAMRDAMMRSIAVLVISCPCAMGLATPTAVMSGIGRAAKQGILIKGGTSLEMLASIETMVFDKTGTLTTGNFQLEKVLLYDSLSEEHVLQIALQLEQHSSHPIAKSIVRELAAATKAYDLRNIHEEKGRGMFGEDELGNKFYLGSALSHSPTSEEHSLYLYKNNLLIAGIDLKDELRKMAAETISALQYDGIECLIISGDGHKKCESIAKEAGITRFYSKRKPEEKLEIISELSQKTITAMVGDGINDAPALARANIGISFGDSTKVALESAEIVLLRNNDLSILADARLLGKHTLITIKQNLFWAFAYNLVAIPLAALGFLNPMAAALFMAFSDVIVIGNSIRLKTKKLR